MPRPITIQIQLEPDLELSTEQLERCRKAMMSTCLDIDCLGYVRFEMYLDQEAYYPK